MIYCRYLLTYVVLSFLLCVHPARAALPAVLTLGDLERVYDGEAKTPSVVTDPPNLNVTWRFVDPAAEPPQPVTETVFRNNPDVLNLSYQSLSFATQQTWGFGDLVGFAGTARNLESVDAVMVTWAKAEDYPEQAAADPSGWRHEVTLSVYSMDASGALGFIGEVTREIFVPWRPLTLPNGDSYPYNGYAFNAHFDFPDGLDLPEQAMFMISYDTENTGFDPIGTSGPYNSLNVAVGGSTTIGTDVDPLDALWVRSETTWSYPTRISAPRFVIKANRIPEPGTAEPPVNAGTWQATARIDDPEYAGETSATFTIQPAPASIELHDLVAIYDGNGHGATASTVPAGLPVRFTYAVSPDLPTALGRYPFLAEIDDPNYVGSSTGELWLGHNFESWIRAANLPPSETGSNDDPDHDFISNFHEYAWGMNAASPDHGSDCWTPKIEMNAGVLSLIYRKNLSATDLIYEVQSATDLDGPASWKTTTSIDLVIGDDGQVETLRSPMALESNESRRFFRVKVDRR